jgi:predicted secreted protein
LNLAKGLGYPVMHILGKRYKDITENGLTKENEISSEDLIGFSKSVYENDKRFRKFCKKFFKRVNKQLSKEKSDGWLKYHLSGIKNPLVVYVELGGVVEYDIKRSFAKTLTMAVVNFFKALLKFFKALISKLIFSIKQPKEVLC